MKRAAILAISMFLLSLSDSLAWADIPVPDPPAAWSRGQQPSSNTVVAAGAAISAVIVAVGLVIGRWPLKSVRGRIAVATVTGVSLLGVWGIAGATILQAQRDRTLWNQWEIDEANRQSNWRGPPQFDGPPEPPPLSDPAPEATGSAPAEPSANTAAAESVQ